MLKTSLAPVDLGRRRHRSDAARAGHELPAASLSRLFKAAIWGLSVDKEISLGAHAKIVAFDDLPSSFVKERLVQRAKPWGEGFAWMEGILVLATIASRVRLVLADGFSTVINPMFSLKTKDHILMKVEKL